VPKKGNKIFFVARAQRSIMHVARRFLSTKVNVLFGSQTGTAAMFASEVSRGAEAMGLDSELIDLQHFTPNVFNKDSLNVLMLASFGKGEPTDNAKGFFAWLMSSERDAERERFSGVPFAVFGCGMSCTYKQNYQAIPRAVEQRLVELGARVVVPRGEGDDSDDIEEDFERWHGASLRAFLQTLGSTDDHEQVASSASEAEVKNAVDTNAEAVSSESSATVIDRLLNADLSTRAYSWDRPFDARVRDTRLLTKGTQLFGKRSRHIEFDLSDADEGAMRYATGDYLAVVPANMPSTVDNVLAMLKLDGDAVVRQSALPKCMMRMPDECTLREALTRYVDLRTPPKRALIRALAEFAESAHERRTLQHLADASDSAFYQQYIVADNRGLASLLRDFASIRCDADFFVGRLSPQKPRFYSIANSGAVGERERMASIAVAILFGPAPDGRPWHGTATRYLDSLAIGDRAPIYVTPSSIRVPDDSRAPIIMAGVGTGISLFRSLWQDRAELADAQRGSHADMLFYGCNSPEDDLYRDELDDIEPSGRLEVHRSFMFHPDKPMFVQYTFAEHGKRIVDLLENHNAHLYVCGHRAVGIAIRRALLNVLRNEADYHYHEAVAFVDQLQAQNRLVEELFE
jgi:sulfite reductase alpha subunit-like flavoprotein